MHGQLTVLRPSPLQLGHDVRSSLAEWDVQVFQARGVGHMPTCQPAHLRSVLKLFLTDGARTVVALTDVGNCIVGL